MANGEGEAPDLSIEALSGNATRYRLTHGRRTV
jgi:hypothetical protein